MKGVVLVDLPVKNDPRGSLTIAEKFKEIPFDIRRVFWISNVPANEERAAHAHKELQQFIVAVAGCFRVIVDNGTDKESFILDRANKGLLVEPGIWITLSDFSNNSVCLVMAPEEYREEEYLKDYSEFLTWKNSKS